MGLALAAPGLKAIEPEPGCQVEDPCPKSESWTPPLSPESYIDQEGIWERRPIPVCWEETPAATARERRWVENAIRTQIEEVTPLVFAGSVRATDRWPRCTPTMLGIRITVANLRPQSDVGQQWRRNEQGGREEELPTLMRLNFVLDGGYAATCGRQREFCIRAIAVHEFLHAIGFLHEQLRCDAPEDCRARFGHQGDFTGLRPVRLSERYDPDSMTNYCKSIYRREVRLSLYDIEAIRHFYALT